MPGSLFAVSVYECKARDGVVRFQDSPCQPGDASRIRHLSGDPIHSGQATAPVAAISVTNEQVETPATAAQGILVPPSSSFICQRDDGTRYISDSGAGNRHAVPLGMLGYPPMSLGQAYGGRNGIGVSAPEVSEVPVVPSRGGGAAGLYTWVEDPCSRVSGAPLCRFYTEQLDDARRRQRHAFSDTARQVSAEIEDWQGRVANCHL